MNARKSFGLVACIDCAALAICLGGLARAQTPPGTVTQYIDPRQQTDLWFGARSHWLQPWRAYLETVPTANLLDAIGINLNVNPEEAEAVCAHLAKNGFRHVRLEYGWGSIAWDNPQRLADVARFEKTVAACRRHGLRPLFLLNAHHGVPCPVQFLRVRLTHGASKGTRTVHLDPKSVPQLVAGRSGLSGLTDYWAAEIIFTKLEADGTATLSKPLPKDLPAGEVSAATLKYLPFYPAKRQSDGQVPPEFNQTLTGWLAYVAAITTEARRVLGRENPADAGFDLEVWNELTFGSNFLSINNYYDPPLVPGERPYAEILRQTVQYVHQRRADLPGVGVSDGFNNQWPWGAGSTAPPGLAALNKHPYAGVRRFPKDQGSPNGIRPVDALGRPDGTETSPGKWQDAFVPKYVSHFPEYPLNAIQTEHLIRDLSPLTTDLYRVPHGRNTHPAWPDGSPAAAPKIWITEVNLDPNGADPGDLAAYQAGGQPPVAPGLTRTDADRMKAKATLRYLVSYVNKGLSRFYFFAAQDEQPLGLNLVSHEFFAHLKAHGNQLPQDDGPLTSPTLQSVRRLVTAMSGETRSHQPRALQLLAIAEEHGHRQFDGDPATAGLSPNPHPPLYNRDVLGFFPYQAADSRFVVAMYVMTRNLAHLYRPEAPATDATRFDLPEEHYRLTIGGVTTPGIQLSLYDPLLDQRVPVKNLSSSPDSLLIDVPLTDSPRLLTLDETPAKP